MKSLQPMNNLFLNAPCGPEQILQKSDTTQHQLLAKQNEVTQEQDEIFLNFPTDSAMNLILVYSICIAAFGLLFTGYFLGRLPLTSLLWGVLASITPTVLSFFIQKNSWNQKKSLTMKQVFRRMLVMSYVRIFSGALIGYLAVKFNQDILFFLLGFLVFPVGILFAMWHIKKLRSVRVEMSYLDKVD